MFIYTVREEPIGVTVQVIGCLAYIWEIDSIHKILLIQGCSFRVMVSFGFNFFLKEYRDSLLYNVIHLLIYLLEFESLASLLSTTFAGFLVRPLDRVFFAALHKYPTFFCRISRVVENSLLNLSRCVAQRVYITSLAISRMALIGLTW